MANQDFTEDELKEFGEIFADLDRAMERLEGAALKLEGRGYPERAHKVRGLTQVVDAQKYLLVQDWRLKPDKAA